MMKKLWNSELAAHLEKLKVLLGFISTGLWHWSRLRKTQTSSSEQVFRSTTVKSYTVKTLRSDCSYWFFVKTQWRLHNLWTQHTHTLPVYRDTNTWDVKRLTAAAVTQPDEAVAWRFGRPASLNSSCNVARLNWPWADPEDLCGQSHTRRDISTDIPACTPSYKLTVQCVWVCVRASPCRCSRRRWWGRAVKPPWGRRRPKAMDAPLQRSASELPGRAKKQTNTCWNKQQQRLKEHCPCITLN